MNLSDQQLNKVLIVNIFGIGDVLFSTPVISALKSAHPKIQIDYMANRRVAPILEDDPDIRQVFVYERDEFVRLSKKSKLQMWRRGREFVQQVKAEGYDAVFDFSMNRMFNLFSRYAAIPIRIGFNYRNRSPYLTYAKKIVGFEGQHVVQFYLDLLIECGLPADELPMRISVNADHAAWAQEFCRQAGVASDRPLIAVFPGGGSSWGKSAHLKRWPGPNYTKLIDKIVENSQAQIILMGDPAEVDLCEAIASNHPNIVKAFGQTSLGQLIGLMDRCDGVICNDGGPLHIAVALGVKTVSLFGPVDEDVYGPWLPQNQHFVAAHDIPCRPCYRRFRMTDCKHISCLQQLDVETVFQKVRQLL